MPSYRTLMIAAFSIRGSASKGWGFPRRLAHRHLRAAALFAVTAMLAVAAVAGHRALRSAGRSPRMHSLLHPGGPIASDSAVGVTDIAIGPDVLRSGVKRFGINLSGQTFYDSGMMLKNLVSRNPGFEGETWQSILRCKSVTPATCTDENQYASWPAGFLDNARFEVLSGVAAGSTGTVLSSTAPANSAGMTLGLSAAPAGLAPGDFLLVRADKPGDAQAGWWTKLDNGAAITTEVHDLSPLTRGKQALRIDAALPGQHAEVTSYFDTTAGRSFLQLHGLYQLQFRAKLVAGRPALPVSFSRQDSRPGNHIYFAKDVPLTDSWQDFRFDFPIAEDGRALGALALSFSASQTAYLLDDVQLERVDGSASNTTAFRDEVVDTLFALKPGVIRFMDNGTSFGSTLDDLLAPQLARRRGGSLYKTAREEDIPIGLHDALALAQAIHAEPWYTLPGTLSTAEGSHLIEYLAGPPSSPYGAVRAALGQQAAWTTVFPVIHLELGNEMWNAGTYGGASLAAPAAYSGRTNQIFSTMRQSSGFKAASFDLILGAQAENVWLTPQELKAGNQQDSISFAPYLFGQFNDASSNEAVFGAMFAEPEFEDTSGIMAQQVAATRAAPHRTAPAVYEVNLGTSTSTNNTITQADLDRVVPSLGAGLAVADHMLLMLRELGITNQCVFALPEFANQFLEPGDGSKTVPLWGSVIDMGGPTNLRRPTYLAEQVVNQALLPEELITHLTGANPTWYQASSSNDAVGPGHPHLLQTFAFRDGAHRTLILINLSRTGSLPVTLSGPNKPYSTVTETRLASSAITDTNELDAKVAPTTRILGGFNPGAPYTLPPFSLTVLDWQAAP